METTKEHIQQFTDAAHKVAQYGLVQCSSGNLSWQIDDDSVLLSASTSWLADLTDQQVAICSLSTGQCTNGVKPTCEHNFHLGILKTRPDVNVVLHFQSPYATAVACDVASERINYNMTIEIPVYIGDPAFVDYMPPGSMELAQGVIDALANPKTNMVLLKNHGLVTVGKNFHDAIQKATFFEMACRIIRTNPNATPLSAEAIRHLSSMAQA